jgi:branched-chain amino acid transport system ATP-binding protein
MDLSPNICRECHVKDSIRDNRRKPNQEDVLTIRKLTVRFGGLTAVDGMDFTIDSLSIRGVIGPNGAGKTTFFNAITGFVKPQAGEIFFQGESILGLPSHRIAGRGIIRTFQNGGVFPEMSVIENVMSGYHRLFTSSTADIMVGRRNARREETEMIEKAMVQLESLGLAEAADKLVGDLSFGQQRLVEVARALFSKPKILFLDEPGAGLSAGEKATLVDILRETRQRQEQYIVLTDHSMDFIMDICDFITVMNFGRRIFEGTPGEIQSNSEVIDAYLGKE